MYRNFREVYEAAQNCQACALAQTRKNVVFGEGSAKSGLMLIGEGPGEWEDKTGRPFVGPAGQLLDRKRNVYIANIVKCRPPYNADPRPEYAQACMGYLREQVRYVRPKVIVLLGRIACQNLLGEKQGITRLHGQIFRRKSFVLIPTYHPSALLRNPDLKRAAWEDFKIIKKVLEESV